MKAIYKYPLEITDFQQITLPGDAEILSVIAQDDRPVLYALVDTEDKTGRPIDIHIFGTGKPKEAIDDLDFMATVSTCDGQLIWHVFLGRNK